MIPVNDDFYDEGEEQTIEIITEPSLTYQLDMENKIVKTSCIDEKEALMQTIYKILHTERYQYEMYDWDYGVELADFIGKDIDELLPEIQDKIEDALTADDRIHSVDYLEARSSKGKLYLKIQVNTIFGEMEVETDV